MIEKIQALPLGDLNKLEIDYPDLGKWLRIIRDQLPQTRSFQPSLNVASVPANSESEQTFTVTGLVTTDLVVVNKPSNTVGLDLVQEWVSAANTLSLKFRNHTGSPIDPGAETYRIMAFRL